jgi:flagellar hook protein FlgE
MTISSSLSAGVAGLNANATRLATISDNIANSGTYGYKRAATDFSNMVITNARGSGVYSAGGVRASSFRLIEERGALVGTSQSAGSGGIRAAAAPAGDQRGQPGQCPRATRRC